jgi:ACR3 family arsenite efflux pump ArsB
VKDFLENRQIAIYLGAVLAAGLAAALVPDTMALEAAVNPALALMLFVTFLQVPLAELRQAATRWRFVAVLLGVNFVAVPALVAVLLQWLPSDPMIRLAVLMVLLTPCIDYVVTFAHLGRADARLLLAATPVLLIVQMLLLPVYLRAFLGAGSSGLVRPGPFLDAFVWLIAMPLVLAGALQFVAARSSVGARLSSALGLLPVPATALVLFVVIAAVLPQLGPVKQAALSVLPVYLAFAVCAPIIGWSIARACRLEPPAARAVAFSAATRNSLVVLPLAFAVPGAVPLLPALIVTQTLVELMSELVYVRLMPKLGNRKPSQAG